jgi:hypothetical protein
LEADEWPADWRRRCCEAITRYRFWERWRTNPDAGGKTGAQATGGVTGTKATGGIVILAVPHSQVRNAILENGEAFDGKVVVDISNPVDVSTFDRLTTQPGTEHPHFNWNTALRPLP